MQQQEQIKTYSAWASVSFFWGTTYLAIRIGVETLPPALFAGIRFLFAGLIFIALLRWRGYALPPRKEWLDLSIVGIALLAMLERLNNGSGYRTNCFHPLQGWKQSSFLTES